MVLSGTVALLTAALLVGCGQDSSQPRSRSGKISMSQVFRLVTEAEQADAESVELPMVVQDNPNASKGKCIAVPGGSGKPGYGAGADKKVFGKAQYTVEVPKTGAYVFWGRALWENGCGNSFKIVFNNGSEYKFNDSIYDAWHWVKGPVVDLVEGKNEIILLNREDGVKLDQFLLTTDTGYIPVGIE